MFNDNTIDSLLTCAPFSFSVEKKEHVMLHLMQEAYRHHFQSCKAYQNFCIRRGFSLDSTFASLAELPYLPVQAFKAYGKGLVSVPNLSIKTQLNSSATSGIASTVLLDKITAKRQVMALASVLQEVLGKKRLKFLILDVDPKIATLEQVGARGAAIRGFLNFAKEANYFLSSSPEGLLLNEDQLIHALTEITSLQEPVVIVGFTYALYEHVVKVLLNKGLQWQLPKGSKIIHIGGWKKLEEKKVPKETFNDNLSKVFGIPISHIIDIYGFTEQMGIIYPDNEMGVKCTPVFADIIIRDPVSFAPLPDGKVGLMEFVTPLPYSYPGIAVLTDDLGVVVGRGGDAQAWQGTHFKILGRAKKAEIRGCGDVMATKVASVAPKGVSISELKKTTASSSKVRILFDAKSCYSPLNLDEALKLEALPLVDNFSALIECLKSERVRLDQYSVDELIVLIHAAANRWVAPDSPLTSLRQQGLLFLQQWCQSSRLRAMANEALRGQRGYLDGFRPVGGNRKKLLKAMPRGLVAHWLAGNVPLLGMLALTQSILTKNANLIKVASTFSTTMPMLLEAFRDLEISTGYGKVLSGNDILASIAVVYFDKKDAAGEILSLSADVRIAWGGKEAVEAIINLPKQPSAEDIVFGPKLSYMCIGKEYLSQERFAKKALRRAAIDASVFDQYACASPHTIFVEEGGAYMSPLQFAEGLALEMDKVSMRIPKAPIDTGTINQVLGTRLKYEFTGKVWHSPDTTWTVCFDEANPGLVEPTYSRVIVIKPISNIMQAASYAHSGIQTIGLAMDDTRKQRFAEIAASHGAERFPEVGRMTYFDSPWDGLYVIDRCVKWISLGGPF